MDRRRRRLRLGIAASGRYGRLLRVTSSLTDLPPDQLEHLVQLYDDDALLIGSLQQFLAAGLSAGEACVVIATPPHRAELETALTDGGFDVPALVAAGRYVALDAQQVVNTFLLDGTPEAQLFLSTLGRVVDRAAAGGRRVRAFGEMVALLWAEGSVPAALEVEALWNTLGETHAFSLLCAYPVASFADPAFAEPFRQVCATHTRLVPAADSGTMTLPAALSSGRQARAYLRRALPSMGCLHVLDDAALLLSEVVNNAVLHANSGVEVQLQRTADSLHVEVADRGAGGVLRRDAAHLDMGGRGVALLASVADAWGATADGASGHRVWFELDLRVRPAGGV